MSSHVGHTEVPYRPVYEVKDPHEVTFGPGASDQGPSQERLFGEVHEETPTSFHTRVYAAAREGAIGGGARQED